MKSVSKLLLLSFTTLTLVGCASFEQPRSQERQQKSDSCWGLGSDNALVYMATLMVKPVACMANDLTRGQPQMGTGGFRTTTVITPAGTYRVITTPGLTTIDKTAGARK